MSDTIRFPFTENVPGVGNNELDQVLLLTVPSGIIPVAGSLGASITNWRLDDIDNSGVGTSSPYGCIVIELVADIAGTVGDGLTNMVGLYGIIDDAGYGSGPVQQRYLIGILGVNLGNKLPQIPIVADGAGNIVQYAQAVNLVACYDRLAIGGVLGDINVPGMNIAAWGRPIRRRVFGG